MRVPRRRVALDDGDRPAARQHTTLRIQETRRLGLSYVPTLEQWRHTFNSELPEVRALGFNKTFVRMWNFYLAYSQAGFAAEYLDDLQIGMAWG